LFRGGISGPETEFPALQFSLLWVISSLSTAVPIPTLLHHQSCAIPVEFLQSSAQGQIPCIVIKHPKTEGNEYVLSDTLETYQAALQKVRRHGQPLTSIAPAR
jgi:hypothetical protein